MVKGNSKEIPLVISAMAGFGADIFVVALCLLVTGYLDFYAKALVREVDLSNPAVGYPLVPSIVNDRLLLILAFLVPTLSFALIEIPSRKDGKFAAFATTYFLGLFESTIFTVMITNVFKLIIGRPRPNFAAVCIEYVTGTTNVCTGNARAVNDARKSFPSGHSSLSFAVAIYLMLYLATKLRLDLPGSVAKSWRILVVLAPPIGAGLIAASRTIDYHHHYADIIVGAVLGSSIAALVFHTRRGNLNKLGERDEVGIFFGGGEQYETINSDAV